MVLAVDAGNSDTVVGLYDQQQWQAIWRIPSQLDNSLGEPSSYYEKMVRLWLLEAGLSVSAIKLAVLSSVVPDLTHPLQIMLARLFGREPITIGPSIYSALPLTILRPYAIGTDLVANAMAAYSSYHQNCVVVDFGTALTFTTVSGDGNMLGVAITPGLKTAVRSLFTNTAQLPEVPLVRPESALGTSTAHAIQAGVMLGYEGLVRSMIARIRAELNGDCVAVATGGLAVVMSSLHAEFIEVRPTLTLDGIREIGQWVDNAG